MKFAVVIFALFATAFAVEEVVPILSQDAEVSFDGSYHTAFETGNHISFQEQGVLKNAGQKDTEAEEVQGSYSYTSPDGQTFQVKYVANENGFQPEGAHLPVAPEVPAAILRALEYIAAHPQAESKKL